MGNKVMKAVERGEQLGADDVAWLRAGGRWQAVERAN